MLELNALQGKSPRLRRRHSKSPGHTLGKVLWWLTRTSIQKTLETDGSPVVELGQTTSQILEKVEVDSDACAEPNHLQEGREAERIEDERACQSRSEPQLSNICQT